MAGKPVVTANLEFAFLFGARFTLLKTAFTRHFQSLTAGPLIVIGIRILLFPAIGIAQTPTTLVLPGLANTSAANEGEI